jgi:hypothetical protein
MSDIVYPVPPYIEGDPLKIASDPKYQSGKHYNKNNKIQPFPGYRSEGYPPNIGISAQEFNYINHNHAEWAEYIKDGTNDNRLDIYNLDDLNDIAIGQFRILPKLGGYNELDKLILDEVYFSQNCVIRDIADPPAPNLYAICPHYGATDTSVAKGYYRIYLDFSCTCSSTDDIVTLRVIPNVQNSPSSFGYRIGGIRYSDNPANPFRVSGEMYYYCDGTYLPRIIFSLQFSDDFTASMTVQTTNYPKVIIYQRRM